MLKRSSQRKVNVSPKATPAAVSQAAALTHYRNWVAKLMNEQSGLDEVTEQLQTTAIG